MDVSGLSSIERISSGTPLHFLECASCTESTTDSESRHFLYMLWSKLQVIMGFPDSSIGKESPCNAGDPGSIPGSGRSAGEGIGYLLQYFWASSVVQLVKNLPAMRETWAQSLGWEDPLENGKATHSSILAWRIPWTLQSMGLQRVGHNWVTFKTNKQTNTKWFSKGMLF